MKTKSNHNATFGPGGFDPDGPEMNACVYGIGAWGKIANGFQLSANILVEHVKSNHQQLDLVVYPIPYLYRHALELLLKVAVQTTGTSEKIKKSHLLLPIWRSIKPKVLERFKTDPSYVDIQELEQIIVDFDSVDGSSFEFRYPSDNKGHRTLDRISTINLQNLSDRANFAIDELGKILNAFQ